VSNAVIGNSIPYLVSLTFLWLHTQEKTPTTPPLYPQIGIRRFLEDSVLSVFNWLDEMAPDAQHSPTPPTPFHSPPHLRPHFAHPDVNEKKEKKTLNKKRNPTLTRRPQMTLKSVLGPSFSSLPFTAASTPSSGRALRLLMPDNLSPWCPGTRALPEGCSN